MFLSFIFKYSYIRNYMFYLFIYLVFFISYVYIFIPLTLLLDV